jgi:formylglycine-generating enzyme required for sulfatase activity
MRGLQTPLSFIVVALLLVACSGKPGTAGGGNAKDGAAGGRCYPNNTCDSGLDCSAGVCTAPTKLSGRAAGPCYPNGTCEAGLACVTGVCTVPPPLADIADGYALIPAGTFVMGSPKGEDSLATNETKHEVTLSRSFYLKTTEVTQGEWERVFGANPSKFKECGSNCPVENISWMQAADYANRLSRADGLQECYGGDKLATFVGLDCKGYRMPTEAEWEYAARAGSTGPQYGDLGFIAWFRDNSNASTHPVAQKQPNAFGLYDMLGNVWEWTGDWYAENLTPASNPVGAATGTYRVFRGNSYDGHSTMMRVALRGYEKPDVQSFLLGVRLARTKFP